MLKNCYLVVFLILPFLKYMYDLIALRDTDVLFVSVQHQYLPFSQTLV